MGKKEYLTFDSLVFFGTLSGAGICSYFSSETDALHVPGGYSLAMLLDFMLLESGLPSKKKILGAKTAASFTSLLALEFYQNLTGSGKFDLIYDALIPFSIIFGLNLLILPSLYKEKKREIEKALRICTA